MSRYWLPTQALVSLPRIHAVTMAPDNPISCKRQGLSSGYLPKVSGIPLSTLNFAGLLGGQQELTAQAIEHLLDEEEDKIDAKSD